MISGRAQIEHALDILRIDQVIFLDVRHEDVGCTALFEPFEHKRTQETGAAGDAIR